MDIRLKKSLDDLAVGKRGKPVDEAFAEIRQ